MTTSSHMLSISHLFILQILYMKGIDAGLLPSIQSADVIMYSIAAGLIIHVVSTIRALALTLSLICKSYSLVSIDCPKLINSVGDIACGIIRALQLLHTMMSLFSCPPPILRSILFYDLLSFISSISVFHSMCKHI